MVAYGNSEINSYYLMENRKEMTEPINLQEHNTKFFIAFVDEKLSPVELDPSIGHF